MLRQDEELLERYQHASIARRSLRAQARAAAKAGQADYPAEAERGPDAEGGDSGG